MSHLLRWVEELAVLFLAEWEVLAFDLRSLALAFGLL